ncbi:hypothetical protein [Arthrobacter sp. SDTb3-6]|uniref:hypothetical protein n=1 Tax=Arthrobacter sp. SDTb3-6 TaxID=2713571 RepID=UPI001C40133D|nr:hypothetical protein [Arthrobacter sp. SDTb3-6]
MIPFFSAGALFVGTVAAATDGADGSLFIGLPVSAFLYWLLTRGIGVDGEAELATAQAAELEQAAHKHILP